MKKFFYVKNEEKVGPVTFEELKEAKINEDTMIWFEGLADWTRAGDLTELREIFELIPPPLEFEEQNSKSDSFHDSLGNTLERKKRPMFTKVWSTSGRIGRTEYLLSIFIHYGVTYMAGYILGISGLTDGVNYGVELVYLVSIPTFILFVCQGAKRCHDRGNSGWFQIIPLYGLWMLLAPGEPGINKYGSNPKGL